MKQLFFSAFICTLTLGIVHSSTNAQEYSIPLNAVQQKTHNNTSNKPTALSLPFFDDFTDYTATPSPVLWKNGGVYISNTLSENQISRGFVVFDANDIHERPYDTLDPFHQLWADSLTSNSIDLSIHTASDSIWISFFCEPGGNGFPPKTEDSFYLFFLSKNSRWIKAWATDGSKKNQFSHYAVPVTDSDFFHQNFAFRFVNKATHGISNSSWNLDYVYLNKNRNQHDTVINDIAFSKNPTNLLKDYTAMPYRHFQTQPASFIADSITAYIKNNGSLSAPVNLGFQTKELTTGNTLGNSSKTQTIAGEINSVISFANDNLNNIPTTNGRAIVETKFFSNSLYPGESLINDTIKKQTVFDNYFAYDDGTAEQAYFLHVFNEAPGITAIEHSLYVPDTIYGISIYFPHTVPNSSYKEFSLIIYRDIAYNGGKDNIIYQQDYYLPEFQDSINKFHTYLFDEPVAMNSGIFYIGIMQAAGGSSDSLYFGLDINKKNGNHRYFNVEGYWESSQIEGALMVRPMLGHKPQGTKIYESAETKPLLLYPNPANDMITINATGLANKVYTITDVYGRTIISGKFKFGTQKINISKLNPGAYFINSSTKEGQQFIGKFLKK